MADMFAKLEHSLKTDMATLYGDLGQILTREEDTERRLDTHIQVINKLKEEILQTEQRNVPYKIKVQENRNRRKNLRIRGLPEASQEEDLIDIMNKIFNPLLGRAVSESLKTERVQRIRRPQSVMKETQRDIIVRFHSYEEKAQIWGKRHH